jgi:uncharacterized protein YbjT (DUF2867 family)
MKIAIIGASGFVGKNLIKNLLENTEHEIYAICLDPENIIIEEKYKNRVYKLKTNVLDPKEIIDALEGIEVAYYLIHMMTNNKNNFYEKEDQAAENTGKALKSSGIKRVIYMSGLGKDKENLSMHLLSRHNTGNILRKYIKEVIELRASMIIGHGSASFEIVKNIVEKSPIIILPKTAKTKTQPIGIDDALLYLRQSITLKINESEIIEIGGKESMSYEEFIKRYSKCKNKKNIIFILPILNEYTAGLLLSLFNPKEEANIGKCMIGSFQNEMIVTSKKANQFFPDINPRKIEEFFV